ncbi:MAG: ribosome maturation factor RimM [Actinomycetota bacterium]|nr:16S rRNA processing protein RimM [Acidimicrobiia bacterium]MDQ3293867.1 ribosome maturation factor RimM [Actinomycetota bacterium]
MTGLRQQGEADSAGVPLVPTESRQLLVGRILRAHGLKGEVVVDLLSSEPEVRLAAGAELETAKGALRVGSSRPFQQKWLVVFAGVGTREAAEALKGTELRAEPIDDPDALWVHDLVGAVVVETDGTARGVVREVLPNPAADLLELDGGALVPVNFVVGWEGDGDDRRLVIDPPAGLFDL